MAFADINNDKYTDIITISDDGSSFTVHLFDTLSNLYIHSKTFKPNECSKITNIAVGRSVDKVRLFLTCQTPLSNTIVKFFDKLKTFDFQESPVHILIEYNS